MKILFLHRSFPSQFKFLAIALSVDPNSSVMFITNDKETELDGITKYVYDVPDQGASDCHPYLKSFERDILHGQAAAKVALGLKKQGIKPDIIVGHSWGTSLFIKEVFPDVPFICYFEWFNKTENSIADFDGKEPTAIKTINEKAMLKCNNTRVLADLCNCDGAMSPTNWQKSQFPKEFQDKIKVIYDGVDTHLCKPDENASFLIKDKNLTLTAKDEVITYATRGLEPIRGFPQFMEAVEKLLVSRPNAHFVIAGKDAVTYGQKLEKGTYKELMLSKFNIDLKRVHFVDKLPYEEYLKLLQISSVHIYLTYPFILSWSFIDAMSVGCCIVSSKTPPVMEVMEDNKNGLLVDFFNVGELVNKVEYALNHKAEMQVLRNNARQTIIEKYSMDICLPEQIMYIFSFLK